MKRPPVSTNCTDQDKDCTEPERRVRQNHPWTGSHSSVRSNRNIRTTDFSQHSPSHSTYIRHIGINIGTLYSLAGWMFNSNVNQSCPVCCVFIFVAKMLWRCSGEGKVNGDHHRPPGISVVSNALDLVLFFISPSSERSGCFSYHVYCR